MKNFFQHITDAFRLPIDDPVLTLLLLLLIVLLCPVILREFKIPSIIGLIIAGVLIGPHCFNILEDSSSFELFSTIGLLYIMFLAGLDLDMNGFRATMSRSLVFGLLTFSLPLLVGYPICRYVLGFDFLASLLTASMFSTHTLVAYPITGKFGVSKNKAVALTVGGTILTDSLVLIILAVVVDTDRGGLDAMFFLRLLISLAIFSIIMFLFMPRVAKWFFEKLESEKQSHFIFVLSVMFFAAFVAELAGLEPIIGSFVAGLMLNRLIPHSSTLMNRIEFIGNALFIPFFLISVGMLLDLSVLFKGPQALVIAMVLTIVSFLGKWLAAFFTQLIYRFSSLQRKLIFGLSSSHAAATLAVILSGYKAGVLNENIINGTIILILITCIAASLVTEHAARKIVEQEQQADAKVNPTAKTFSEHFLVPARIHLYHVDKLLDFAILLKTKQSKQPISIVSVIPNDENADENTARMREKMEKYIQQGISAEVPVDLYTTIDHNFTGGITRMSHELNADTIITELPSKFNGMIDKLLGSQMSQVLETIEKNVFICRLDQPYFQNKRILLLTTPFAELESGFEQCFLKVIKLSGELSLAIDHRGTNETAARMKKLLNVHRLNATIRPTEYDKWLDFDEFAPQIRPTDLVVAISSRPGFVSYSQAFDQFVNKFTKRCPEINKIVIYPQQNREYLLDAYEDFSGELITTGFNFLQRLNGVPKFFKNVFSKKNDADK